MPIFYLHFNNGHQTFPSELGVEFAGLEQAYLEVCAAVPDMARDLLVDRRDPLAASFTIADAQGRTLMVVPLSEILKPSEWRMVEARRRPHGGPRSSRARNELALSSFRRMFGSANAGCVLLSPEMYVVDMNEFGARHSHVDVDAIRGASIYDIFDLRGEPKSHFESFMSLAQAGAGSEVIDLPYLVLDAEGQTTQGWWNARTWPIFDDDNHLIGFVEWAEPHTVPTHGGKTKVRVSKPS